MMTNYLIHRLSGRRDLRPILPENRDLTKISKSLAHCTANLQLDFDLQHVVSLQFSAELQGQQQQMKKAHHLCLNEALALLARPPNERAQCTQKS